MSEYARYPTNTGGGSGTVTSVSLSAPSLFTVSGSPVTTSGTLALSLAPEADNTVFAGPATGAAAPPTFRALVLSDLPAPIILNADTPVGPSPFTTTPTPIVLSNVNVDTAAAYNPATGYYTAPAAGYYGMTFSGLFQGTANVGDFVLIIFNNATTTKQYNLTYYLYAATGSFYEGISGTTLALFANVGDQINVLVLSTAPSLAFQVSPPGGNLTLFYIGK
jgi:hypothetical protein